MHSSLNSVPLLERSRAWSWVAHSPSKARRGWGHALPVPALCSHLEEGNTMAEPITVLLVDDHALVRKGVRGFLETQPDIVVVAEAGTAQEAVQLASEYAPDVVLMDLLMPGM